MCFVCFCVPSVKMAGQPVVSVTKAVTLSACHRLHSRHLSESENLAIFGKCNHPNYHGHNYRIEVTVRGPLDPRTGFALNISDLKVLTGLCLLTT